MNDIERRNSLIVISMAVLCVAVAWLAGLSMKNGMVSIYLDARNLPPSWRHPFGTDWLGRDMLLRTMSGLTLSLRIGLLGALLSGAIALCLGLFAMSGRFADRIVTMLTDVMLSLPHLISMIIISFVLGGGAKGIIIGVGLTHWPQLTRLIRAEVWQLKSADYIQVSQQLGKSKWWIIRRHMVPHVMPQLGIGLILLFPHVILHESALTFIGLGLTDDTSAIGVILTESMRYLTMGMWWLALFPGLCLLLVVLLFARLAAYIQRIN